MADIKKSTKQLKIDKAMANIVLAVSGAAAISAFSLVAVKNLVSQHSYQSRVISQQTAALKVAKQDVTVAQSLSATYQAFTSAPFNLIGGSPTGTTAQDGDNAKIVLDALPSKYDFPAVVSSIEKLSKDRGFKIDSLSGTDDVTLADAAAAATPVAVAMPFQLGVTGSYTATKDLISVFDRSIRPISITSIQLSGSEANISIVLNAKTYYQPAKKIVVNTKVIK